MALTDLKCKASKPQESPYQLKEGGGMFLQVMPNGAKYWRLLVRLNDKYKRIALGVYPEVSLIEARELREEAKKKVKAGIDPIATKKAEKRRSHLAAGQTFESICREWYARQLPGWCARHAQNVKSRLEADIYPAIGARPIAEITAQEMLEAIQKIEKRGAHDIARRSLQICKKVFVSARVRGLVNTNPADGLVEELKRFKRGHFAALEAKDMPGFLQALERNEARLYPQTRNAVELLMLTFTRTNELTTAKKTEFDLEAGQWEIPAERMKMKKPHIVPLSPRAVEILKDQFEITGNSQWVFPNQARPRTHMSNNTILSAIQKRLGYDGAEKPKMTGHGFRALAMSTIKEKLGFRHEVIDRQLAHAPQGKNDRAYDRAQFLDERKRMMNEWAEWLAAQASGKALSKQNVVDFKKAG